MVQRFARTTAIAGASIAGIGAAILAPLTGFLRSGMIRADLLADLQDQFGLTAAGASKLAYAFDVAGDGGESLGMVLKGLAKANTSGMPLEQFAQQTADALLAIEDPSVRATQAMEMMGRGGLNFLKTMKDLKQLMAEAPIIDQETIDASAKFNDEWNKIKVTMGAALLPIVGPLTEVITLVSGFVRENAELVRVLAVVGSALAVTGVALVALGATISAVTTIAGFCVTVWGVLTAAVTFFLTPVGLVIAAVAAVGVALAALVAATETGRAAFRQIAGFLMEIFGGVWAAAKKGDMQLAWDILVAGGTFAFQKLMSVWTQLWNSFKAVIVDGWHQSTTQAALAMVKAMKAVRPALKAIGEDPFEDIEPDVLARRIERNALIEQKVRDKARRADQSDRDDQVDAAAAELARLTALARKSDEVKQLIAGVVGQARSAMSFSGSSGSFSGAGAGQVFGAMTSPLLAQMVGGITNVVKNTAMTNKILEGKEAVAFE